MGHSRGDSQSRYRFAGIVAILLAGVTIVVGLLALDYLSSQSHSGPPTPSPLAALVGIVLGILAAAVWVRKRSR